MTPTATATPTASTGRPAAFHAVTAAHTEARGARNGVGLVKLMGRDSGFIACSAALATGEANAVLIPEVPFSLEGTNGLLELIERRLASRGHAVVITAEGAGQDLIPAVPVHVVVLVDNVRDANFYDPTTPDGQTYIADGGMLAHNPAMADLIDLAAAR